MGRGTKPVWICDVCNHVWICAVCDPEWLSRNENKPRRCASCKTLYWDMNHMDAKNAS